MNYIPVKRKRCTTEYGFQIRQNDIHPENVVFIIVIATLKQGSVVVSFEILLQLQSARCQIVRY